MGNFKSTDTFVSDGEHEEGGFQNALNWTSEMWTPNLSVLMSADSKHVVVRYRTNGTEVIELKARDAERKIAKELVDFGKALHSFSSFKNGMSKPHCPTFTVFLNDSEGSSHHCGFVEVSLLRQAKKDNGKTDAENNLQQYDTIESVLAGSLESATEQPKVDKIDEQRVVCESVIERKVAASQRSSVESQLIFLEDTRKEDGLIGNKSANAVRDLPERKKDWRDFPVVPPNTSFPRKLRSQKYQRGSTNVKERSSSLPSAKNERSLLTHGLTVKDIKSLRQKNHKHPCNSVHSNDERRLSDWAEKHHKMNIISCQPASSTVHDTSDTIKSAVVLGPQVNTGPKNGSSSQESETESTLTPTTEIELSEDEKKLCTHRKLSEFPCREVGLKDARTERKSSCAKIVLQRPRRKSLISQKAPNGERQPAGRLTDLDARNKPGGKGLPVHGSDPRTGAWLAFVRTLKHHDPETSSEASLSDFSDYDLERKLSISPDSDQTT